MVVPSCAHCGAPRDPRAARCGYCGAHFADGRPGAAAAGVDADIEDAIRRQNLILAIKIYRERHGSSLLEAKNAVEDLKRRLGL